MPPTPLPADEVRRNLVTLAKLRGESLTYLSRVAGKRTSYLAKFVREGNPKMLPEGVRLLIAMELNIDERLIGGRDPWVPMLTDQSGDSLVEHERRSFPSPLAICLSRLAD